MSFWKGAAGPKICEMRLKPAVAAAEPMCECSGGNYLFGKGHQMALNESCQTRKLGKIFVVSTTNLIVHDLKL